MSLPALENLLRIGQLKAEPRNLAEVSRMLAMARTRLLDARLTKLSNEGRFALYSVCTAAGIVHPNAHLDEKHWGSKEFAVLDPDGNLITFAEWRDA